ncbi:iron ABC transporter permease [Marinobacter oulmenensis]|uniref:Iron complex transport system permease protein n=1 Tax=Marinobacter oulmenensis TaxID=643747 RepID=A0A840UBM3_9GAMM|nr:iron complex transport system permease protein [Marinobacter oulmenensis]
MNRALPAPFAVSSGTDGQRTRLATGIGLLLLLALSTWQGTLRFAWPDLDSWLAPLQTNPDMEGLLLWWSQMPRVVAGILVGAGLAVAGTLMQLVTRNPLVSPDLLGITAGAQFGVILGLMLPAAFGLPLILVGGILAATLTFALAGGSRTTPLRLVLAGLAMAQLLYALITLFLSLNQYVAMVLSIWDTGSLSQFGWGRLQPALWLMPPLLVLLFLLRRLLNMALLDDPQRQSLGLSPRLFKALVIMVGTVITALAINVAGPLGFIGLVAPNLVRYGFGVRWPSRLLPLATLWGAVLTLAADVVVAALADVIELPLATLSAVLGGLAVILLLRFASAATGGGGLGAHAMTGVPSLRVPLSVMVMILLVSLVLVLGFGLTGVDGLSLLTGVWQGQPLAWQLAELRLPRLLVDAAGGALFATAGLILQAVTRNPLASPGVLGVSQVSALAVLASLLLMPELGVAWRLPFAWMGAALALALVVLLNVRHNLEPLRLILTGFALTGMASGAISLLIGFYSLNVTLALTWMSGSSYGATWSDAMALLPWLVLGLSLAVLARRWMDLLALGDGVADSLGVGAAGKRLMLLVLASLLIAAAVSVLGPVAFVGLLVPHAVRLLGFYHYRDRLIVTPLMGAVLLMLADVGGQRLLAPLDLPLGIMTATIGGPVFLYLLSRTYLGRS